MVNETYIYIEEFSKAKGLSMVESFHRSVISKNVLLDPSFVSNFGAVFIVKDFTTISIF